ncbi:MAG TPA: DegT/DnrJ/EryC1/StrS family aminotransferase, partial [Acidimicrobiales bacterium]|nr:DegT/DnrJ/EryC1/StrS family aminotransferase [Acidimicrobiales bacterium]
QICAAHGVPLIEDAAEALGATYHARPVGCFGAAAVLSFNGNKIITTSSGGALLAHSASITERARHLATQAREPEVHYEHVDLGYNYRMSNLLAALGLAQLAGLDQRLERRRQVHLRYRAALGEAPGFAFMPDADYGEPNHWLTCVLVDPAVRGLDRDQLRRRLDADDIEARPTWKPLHLQPLYSGAARLGGAAAEAIFERGLCLPSGSNLRAADQKRVIGHLLEDS